MKPGLAIGVVLVLFGTLPAAESTRPGRSATAASDGWSLLLQGSAVGAQVGPFDFNYHFADIGIGLGWRWFGVLVGTRLFEAGPGGFNGDYMFYTDGLPLLVYAEYGLFPGKMVTSPVLYAYGAWDVLSPGTHTFDQTRVGIGAKWTFWAFSPGVTASWRRSRLNESSQHRDFWCVGITADVGGWWPVSLACSK